MMRMTIYMHELRRGRNVTLIWAGVMTFMMVVCMLLYPEMKGEMDVVSDMFANMGSFTAAFGMDKISFGEAMGFYGIECGNVLGIGGAIFAALMGASALSKEENERTAEFLLTHPISRARVITQKLLATFTQVIFVNALCFAGGAIGFVIIGEPLQVEKILLFHAALLIMQLEISCICFFISSFMRRGGSGMGIGVAMLAYVLSLFANISETASAARYITPFCYSQAQTVMADMRLDTLLVSLGVLYSAAAVIAAYVIYIKKDIAA